MAEAILTLSEALDRANAGKPIAPTAPKHLKGWSRPKDYFGAEWSSYYSAAVGQSRDCDCLEQSNFGTMLAALGGESDTVIVLRESHWAVGWVEWIAIHELDTVALRKADEQCERLECYPVLALEFPSLTPRYYMPQVRI
jgi:hypothetical protein